MSSQRVRLITEVQTASVRQNTGEDSAESYLWSQILSRSQRIIVVQQARELGINISFRDFARLGVPVTLAGMAGLLAWVRLMS
jgi:hypothetical protein